MNRREFLFKSGITTASTLVVSGLIGQNIRQAQSVKSVLIIGAGLAGLAAGLYLRKQGIKVTILESRNRVGGRVFSFAPKTSKNQRIELGAEWVGNSHERVIELCEEFGLTLENNQFETDLITEGKYRDKKTEIWNSMSDTEKTKLDKMDWWRYLSNKGLTDRDLQLRELIDSTDFGESIRHTSAYAAFAEYAESSEKNEMDLKIKGGNSLLPEKMAAAIGLENILLGQKVIEINQQNTNEVKLVCEGGKSFTADKVICTAPTFSLMKINWNPVLPKSTSEALNELQYARIGKFPIVFSERFW
ncbi:MAG TPA: FAD-dependent oxidoreductase, partial [Saprospiraceae bacterium]|nr:FAD-dependent oxidoreductase [Saprospiraceae bacterium]